LGFAAYYSFYLYLFVRALKLRKNSLSRGFVLAVLITVLACEIVEVTYNLSPVQFMLFFAYYRLNAEAAYKNVINANELPAGREA